MARAAAAAENPPETEAKPKRPKQAPRGRSFAKGKTPEVGVPFEPGVSPNPGGRPKGLARRVREMVGGDGDLMINWCLACIGGKLQDGTVTSVADRQAAVKWLGERGWGKPAQFVPIEDEDPLDLSDEATDRIAAEFDARLDELAARRASRTSPPPEPEAKTVDGRPRPRRAKVVEVAEPEPEPTPEPDVPAVNDRLSRRRRR